MLIQTLKLPLADVACGGKTELSLKSMRVETFKTLKLPNLHRFLPACGHGLGKKVHVLYLELSRELMG